MKRILFLIIISAIIPFAQAQVAITESTIEKVYAELVAEHGESESERVNKGIRQLAEAWREEDGNEKDFEKFCNENFMSKQPLSDNFFRLQNILTYMSGRVNEMRSLVNESRSFTDTEPLAVDRLLHSALPHVNMDAGNISHFIRLNFPYYSEDEKLENMFTWSREKWAMVRLGDWIEPKTSYKKSDYADKARDFKRYMERYFFRMDAITNSNGELLFNKGTLLHSHRGLRDVIKDEYTKDNGLNRQEVMNMVIERITEGNVPKLFLSDSSTCWNPFTNKLYSKGKSGKLIEIKEFETEGAERYAGFLACALDKMATDKEKGTTVMARTFGNGSLSFENSEKLIRQLLSSPILKDIGKLIEKNLGRSLQPFDIWYSGFQEQAAYSSDYLDSLTKARYPDPAALEADIPMILQRMGFPEDEAYFIGSRTMVRPVISGGYSSQADVPGGTCLMTTMFGQDGLDYKSYRVAMHELGHTVCAVYCTNGMDFSILAGVPSAAITEGFAELFAYKNAAGLGLYPFDGEKQNHMLTLAAMWYMFEMGGQSLVELESWKWLYANPNADAEEVRKGIMSIAANVWNEYFAEVFGGIRDQHILSIYNHYITGDLYLYNYFMSNAIMYQLHSTFNGLNLATNLKEICLEGITSTERWMKNAMESEISVDKLLKAAENGVEYFNSTIR